ncbi:MAG: hypothetical protein ABJB74_00565 [Gemmatimonas sp.]
MQQIAGPDGAAPHAGFNLVADANASWNPFVTANNDGVEFWDNYSIDGERCNIGWYANGPFGPACSYPLAGSPAHPAEFIADQYYGKNAGADPAPFTFQAGTYEVVFLDGFRGYGTEPVGWFTKAGLSYTLNPIAPAVSSVINGTVTFTSATPWGFWIQPQNPISGGDACGGSVVTMCSDDSKVQQFALMRKADNSKFLVGIEDQPGVAIPPAAEPPGGGDKDFNDFFLSVRKVASTETLDGRMTGSATSKSADVKASITIHCDNKLSNNIEIQGPNKLNWHLDKNSLTNIVCQLTDNPAPPVAPINIFSGDATGTLNNVPGSRLSFRFIDNGEPGKNDRFAITIWDANNVVVLNMPEVQVSNGNLQAHFDQPHGQKK